jgi:hypothetical protein
MSLVRTVRHRPWGAALSALFFAVATCSPADGADSKQTMDEISSWLITVEFVAAEWVDEAIPTGYALRTLQRAEQEISAAFKQLANANSTPASKEIDSVLGAVRELKAALQGSDRNAIARGKDHLAAARRTLAEVCPGGCR